jgi:hypothetical protein
MEINGGVFLVKKKLRSILHSFYIVLFLTFCRSPLMHGERTKVSWEGYKTHQHVPCPEILVASFMIGEQKGKISF